MDGDPGSGGGMNIFHRGECVELIKCGKCTLISSSVCKRESEKERGWEERRGIIMWLCKLSLVARNRMYSIGRIR